MKKVREELISIPGGDIPITLYAGEAYAIEVDGVLWLNTNSRTHAVVLFELMKDHLIEYMNYKKL